MALVLLLMLSLLCGGLGKVVQDFERECGQFFANGKSPTRFSGRQYKQICQTRNGVSYYATFYDTENRIPVYSAYVFEGQKDCKRLNKWYIEPQVDDDEADQNLAFSKEVKKRVRGESQALNKDYQNSRYDRGHLAPVYLANSQHCADATFTLTNAAPQAKQFNSVLWWYEEKSVSIYLESLLDSGSCKPAYLVTGVVPGTSKIKSRVNLPSHFWTAYCCLDQNKRCSDSGGIIATNDNNSNIRKMSVAGLEAKLSELYGKAFQLFPLSDNNESRQSLSQNNA